MAIVDFQQDPEAKFGTGNFRDDKGRVMYLYDPDTASRFSKTMPGSSPPKPADQRLAALDTSGAEQFGPPKSPGAALIDQLDQTQQKLDAAPNVAGGAPNVAGGAPNVAPQFETQLSPEDEQKFQAWKAQHAPNDSGEDYDLRGAFQAGVTPGADGHWPDTFKKPNHPTFSVESKYATGADAAKAGRWEGDKFIPAGGAAGAAGGAGAALVQNYTKLDDSMKARSQKRPVELPEENSPGKIPLSGVRSARGAQIEEGRPIENVLEQVREEDPLYQKQVDTIRTTYDAKAKAEQNKLGGQMGEAVTGYFRQGEQANAAQQEHQRALREQARLRDAIATNDQALNPDRYVQRMSTGKKISTIILAALNGAFNAMAGIKENGVLKALYRAMDADIDRQKLEIANKRASLGNDLQHFIQLGFDAKTAEGLARDKQYANLSAFYQLKAARDGVPAEYKAQADALIAPVELARTQRKGDLLAGAEDKVRRTAEESKAHEVPQPVAGMSPQDVMALLNVKKERIEQANAGQVGEALGHEVSPEEAGKLKQDAQEFAGKVSTNKMTRGNLLALGRALGLRVEGGRLTGDPDPGVRPLGITQFDSQARRIDRLWSAVSEAKVMGMPREPAAKLQDMYGKAVERPFNDSDIVPMLNDLLGIIDRSDENLRQGYGEAATLYDRTPTGGGRPQGEKPAPAPNGKKPPTSAERLQAERERARTQQMMQSPGGQREEE